MAFWEGKKAGDVLATADFRVFGKAYGGKEFDETVHAVLAVSGASAYGNRTCMGFEWSNGNFESFDTRYDNVTPATFAEFAKKVLDENTMSTLKVEEIK